MHACVCACVCVVCVCVCVHLCIVCMHARVGVGGCGCGCTYMQLLKRDRFQFCVCLALVGMTTAQSIHTQLCAPLCVLACGLMFTDHSQISISKPNSQFRTGFVVAVD